MVALGSFLKNKKIVSNRTVFEVFEAMAPQGKKELIEVNIKALEEGARLND
jgi:Pyruvate/2-oxoacid:ferredoxin oxidoreductase gamma subunit